MADKSTLFQADEEPKYAMKPFEGEPVCIVQCTSEIQLEEKKRIPRRILHFSDGILEDYSTDEEEEEKTDEPSVNQSTLSWSNWMVHYLGSAASNTLSAADYCGEKLASFFGVTSPKYQYILDEIQRRQLEEREEKEREENKAKRMLQAEMCVNSEIASTQDSDSSVIGLGYDNVVFHTEETNRSLEKF